MAIVKDIIDKHGWNIDIESTQGKGTKVTITIPATA
jgi:signal transduction histidine kinase